MGVAETFNRKFNKTMRGYSPDEVDAAVDALLRYSTELEEANAEFEIANNDLIDERTALLDDIENLTKENARLQESNKKIEAAYNDFKERFGEARDLVVNAKKRASDIISTAEKNAERLVADAEKDAVAKTAEVCREKEAYLGELDSQISKKKATIDKLEACFSELLTRVKEQLGNVQILVDEISPDADYSDIPDLSEIAPYAPPVEMDFDDTLDDTLDDTDVDVAVDDVVDADAENAEEAEELFIGFDEVEETTEENQQSKQPPQNQSVYIDFNSIQLGNGGITDKISDGEEQGGEFFVDANSNVNNFSSLGPIWTADKPRDQQTNSQIISSVNQINDRVKARKNNKPHIN